MFYVQVATAESVVSQAQHLLQRWQQVVPDVAAADADNFAPAAVTDSSVAQACQECSSRMQSVDRTGASQPSLLDMQPDRVCVWGISYHSPFVYMGKH